MALSPEDIDTLSRLLDSALELEPARREAWIAALPPHERALAEPLREMLASEDALAADQRFAELPRMTQDEAVAERGEVVGPYRLLHEIGRGGMGSVWLAERSDGRFKRQVALKLPRLAWGAGLAERMAREREIGALLEHPAIARMYDAGVDERGRPYLAFEYIDGQPIDAWCESQALGVRQRLGLFVQVVRAVAYAHGRLVVHRDLKPSNVLVTQDGQAHLLDFGIAKLLQDATPGSTQLTREQGRVFTPHYASPEQVAGEPVTVASDIYALGVLLYELLTGELPLAPRRETLGAIEDAILEGHTVPASTRVKDKAVARALRGEIDAILAKAMQREPQRRYGTAEALALDIERHLQGETISARPDSLGYRLHKAMRRHWIAISAVSAVMVAVVSGSAVAVVQAQKAARSAEREQVVREFVADVFRVNSRVNPANTAMRPSNPLSLLEGGAQLIQQRFKGQPDMQAELFGVVGGVFSDMGAYKLAAEYAGHQVESLALVKADATDQARALLRFAQAQVDNQQFADAEARIRRVLELVDPESPLGVDARVLLADVLNKLGHPEASIAGLESVEAWLKARGEPPTTALAKALALRGKHLRAQNHNEEAYASFQRAIDVAIAAEGRLSTTAIEVRIFVAHYRAASTRDDLARAAFDAAAGALHELGGAHEARALMETAEFAWRRKLAFDHGSSAEAEAVIDASRRGLAALPFPTPDWFARRLDYLKGSLRLVRGATETGLPLVETSAPMLLAVTQAERQVCEIDSALGQGLMHAGRHEEADAWLRKALDCNVRMGWGRHPYTVGAYLNIAFNLRMKRDFVAAASALDATPKFDAITGEGGINPQRYGRAVEWERAQLLLEQGNPSAALKLLQANAPLDGEFDEDLSRYDEAAGVAMCNSGAGPRGLALLRKALALGEKTDFSANAPWIARLRAEVGLCALAVGESALATEQGRLARAAFAAQAGVSPYFRQPSLQLDRRLGIRPTSPQGA